MKGVVFTEFLAMIEQRYSLDMVDELLEEVHPGSGGAYTAVGTYPHEEMVALVLALAGRVQVAPGRLLGLFGEYLFGRFVQLYPRFFSQDQDALGFLAGIEDIIHAEVRKLYPDAELPRICVETRETDRLVLCYRSGRHMEDLAEGLIRGCAAHFGQTLHIERQPCGDGGDGVRFILARWA